MKKRRRNEERRGIVAVDHICLVYSAIEVVRKYVEWLTTSPVIHSTKLDSGLMVTNFPLMKSFAYLHIFPDYRLASYPT
jgi:hypothetical protein